MKVALVGDWPPPLGGVSVHVAALARALRARGIEVRVLDVGRGGHSGDGVVPARGAARAIPALARAAAEGFVVHAHTNGANARSWALAAAAGRARLPGAPRAVLTLHSGLLPAWLAARRARQAVARAACAPFGRIVAVSDAIARALGAAGVAPGAIAIQPAFLGVELTPGTLPGAIEALAPRAPLFCAAVAPGPTYGEDVLVAAFAAVRARYPDAALALFGRGSERGPGAAAGLARGVVALGEVDHPSALAVVARADVFVRATRADGDALSVREALALGRAVVASDVGHRPPGCLLFRAGDPVALAAGMLEAVEPGTRPRPAVVTGPDPVDALVALYRSVTAGERTNGAPPLPSDSARVGEAPSSGP
ncbi:MAG: glycosyltransferase [Anaeromyxobacteraceae bacterium]